MENWKKENSFFCILEVTVDYTLGIYWRKRKKNMLLVVVNGDMYMNEVSYTLDATVLPMAWLSLALAIKGWYDMLFIVVKIDQLFYLYQPRTTESLNGVHSNWKICVGIEIQDICAISDEM